ncbi:MAG TPA: NAD(+)/NADH kinase [bacterium]|nr:NAD(+)/NADH kinase [bacterium]
MKRKRNILFYTRKKGLDSKKQNKVREILADAARRCQIDIYEYPEIPENIDLVIAAGGDGTFLDASHIAVKYDVPVAGLNIGQLGFLAEINMDEWHIIDSIFHGKYKLTERMMIDIKASRGENLIFNEKVLNEVVVHRTLDAPMLLLSLKYGDEELPEYKADGVIVATPTGSTAYNLSFSGPIIYPTEESFVINAMAPHALTHRPIVLPSNKELVITIKDCKKSILNCDGRHIANIKKDDVITIKMSDKKLKYIANPERTFFSILSEKLHLGKRM